MEKMGIREYARHRGVSHVAVKKAIDSGRIVCDENRKIDPVLADSMWEKNTDKSRLSPNALQDKQNHGVEPVGVVDPVEALDALGIDSVEGGEEFGNDENLSNQEGWGDFNRSKALKEFYNAQRAGLALKKEAGELVDRQWAEEAAFTLTRTIRDSILNVPARLANHLAVLNTVEACEDLLEQELVSVLSGIDVTKLFANEDAE